eukprot:4373741-Amphidinium_carterae.1
MVSMIGNRKIQRNEKNEEPLGLAHTPPRERYKRNYFDTLSCPSKERHCSTTPITKRSSAIDHLFYGQWEELSKQH